MTKILEVKNISKTLSRKEILKDISFSVKAGEIYGFLGPNGAGKTTAMKLILGLIEPNS
jgi:ABC-2 type transport system ATP-binding protein